MPDSHRTVPLARVLFPVLGIRTRVWLVLAVGMFAALVWTSPVSPAALGRADAALGRGTPDVAARRYDAVAAWSPWAWMREEALLKGAMVRAVDLGDPDAARQRLFRLVREHPRSTRLPEVWERIGQLQLAAGKEPAKAARAFAAAYSAAPDDQDAARRLVLAARARMEANDRDRALAHWLELERRFPERRATALLGRAAIALSAGDAQSALSLYEDAGRAASLEEQRSLARLGVATCLERLGNLEEALAALDGADLPDPVLESRREGIRARSLAQSP